MLLAFKTPVNLTVIALRLKNLGNTNIFTNILESIWYVIWKFSDDLLCYMSNMYIALLKSQCGNLEYIEIPIQFS